MKRGIWAMFAGYCLLASTVWVIAPAPSKVRGVVYAAVGLGAVVWNGRRRWGAARDLGRMAVWSVLVVGVPEVLTGVAGQHVANIVVNTVPVLIPMLVVLVAVQGSEPESAGAWGSMVPAVGGAGGILATGAA